MNDTKLAEANKLLQDAKTLESSSSGFMNRLLGGGGAKLEEAASCYNKAANQFKAHKQWERAGSGFKNAARLQKCEQVNCRHEAAQSLVNAGMVFRKSNAKSAVDAYHEAIEIFTDMGRFNMAAKHLATCGDIFSEIRDFNRAIESYNQAADYYRSEDSNTTADKHDLQAADLLATEMEKYIQALEKYEMCGNRSAESSLLKYSAKNHFFKAALCHLNIDVINCKQALSKYIQILPSFQDQREYNLLLQLIESTEEAKVDKFTDAVFEYDNISRLDDWTTTMLLRAKKRISDEDDDLT